MPQSFIKRRQTPAAAFDWNGIYLGGHVGYGRGEVRNTLFDPLPSTEAAAAFLDKYAASNAAVARKYLTRENGILFTEPPPHNRPERLPSLDIDKAIEIAAKLWQWQEMRFKRWSKNE